MCRELAAVVRHLRFASEQPAGQSAPEVLRKVVTSHRTAYAGAPVQCPSNGAIPGDISRTQAREPQERFWTIGDRKYRIIMGS